MTYSVAFSLYNEDATRGIEVRMRDGRAYFVEMEHVAGDDHLEAARSRRRNWPLQIPEAAEAAAIVSPWFTGDEISN